MHVYSSSSQTGHRWTTPVFCALIYMVYLARFGYGYGSSDQDEFIPYLFHQLNASEFESDWFVQTQAGAFSVRTYFVVLLRAICLIAPPWLAVAIVYLGSWIGVATAVFSLGYTLSGDRVASAGAVLLVLVATPFWTLGGNDLVHSMLVPSMTAWAFGLWGLVLYLEQRPVLAALLLGVATWFQALVGLQLAGITTGAVLFSWSKTSDARIPSQAPLFEFGALYALAASPALIPLFYQQFTANAAPPDSAPSLFYIMAAFRNPHHYLFSSFDQTRMVQFAGLLAAGLGGLIFLRKRTARFEVRLTLGLLSLCGLFWIAGYVGTEIFPSITVAKLQLFKTSVLAKTLLGITVCALVTQVLPARLYRFADRLVSDRMWASALLLAMALAGLSALQPDRFREKVYPFSHRTTPLARVEDWIRDNTPLDAIVAIPPTVSSFRSHARRAIPINYKAFPYRDADIYVWYERLLRIAPMPAPARMNAELQGRMDDAYHSLSEAALIALGRTYGISFVLREAPLAGRFNALELVYENEGWWLYRMETSS